MGVHDASRSAVLDLSGDGAGLDEHASIATAVDELLLALGTSVDRAGLARLE
jgi:hypothetical protein